MKKFTVKLYTVQELDVDALDRESAIDAVKESMNIHRCTVKKVTVVNRVDHPIEEKERLTYSEYIAHLIQLGNNEV